jgi:hypothetical protein
MLRQDDLLLMLVCGRADDASRALAAEAKLRMPDPQPSWYYRRHQTTPREQWVLARAWPHAFVGYS